MFQVKETKKQKIYLYQGVSDFLMGLESDKLTQVPSPFLADLAFRVQLSEEGTLAQGRVVAVWSCSALRATFENLTQIWASGLKIKERSQLESVFLLIKLVSLKSWTSTK